MTTISLNAVSDMDPCPRVEISITGTGLASVWRVDGPDRELVRGAQDRSMPALVVDYAAPLGRSITYIVEDESGSASATTTVAHVSPHWDTVVAQDPYDPQSARLVVLDERALTELSFPRRLESHRAAPGDRRPIVVGGQSQAATFPLTWFAESPTDLAAQDALFANLIVLLRGIPPLPLPGAAYISTSGASAVLDEMNDSGEFWTWTALATLVRPPAAGVTVPVWTWDDVESIYATWDAVRASKATWNDLLRDPRP